MRVLTDISDITAIEEEWRALSTVDGNPFTTPDWYAAWLGHYGEGSAPFVVASSADDGRLRGLVPLVLDGRRRGRVLRTAGGDLADYFHPVCRPEDEAEVMDAAAHALREHRAAWSSVVVRNANWQAGWPAALAATKPGLAISEGTAAGLPHIDVEGLDWDGYLAGKSPNFRSQLGAARRRLERDHEVAFRHTTTPDQLADDMSTFFALHAMRHRDRSSLTDERAQAFHLDFAGRALGQGWLRLSFMTIDGTAAAALYAWRIGPRYSYYNAGFDTSWLRSKVGFLMLCETIREAVAEDVAEYDLLLGEEGYKSRFATGTRYARTVVLAPWHSRRRLLFGARRTLRRLAHALPPGAARRIRPSTHPTIARTARHTTPMALGAAVLATGHGR